MRIPESLVSLVDDGIIDEVVRPLMSGKEAQVFLVLAGGEERVAKVYKEAHARSFKHRAAYTEGRRVKSSRDKRAIDNRSRHGRAKEEAAWRSAEVDMIYRLHYAGVRVPVPYNFCDGVLVMELIRDADGFPAPRLGDVALPPDDAVWVFETLMREVVKMLCAGVVHGDLSDFNVLMGANGPVVIDFPQAMNAASNQNARTILVRDVANLYRFLSRSVPVHPGLRFAEEMWDLYQRGELTPDTALTGRFTPTQRKADTHGLMRELDAVNRDEARRRAGRGLPPMKQPEREPRAQAPQSEPGAQRRRMVETAPPARDARGPRPQQRLDAQRSQQPRPRGAQRPEAHLHPDAKRHERPGTNGDPQVRSQAHPPRIAADPSSPQEAASGDAPRRRRRRRRRPPAPV